MSGHPINFKRVYSCSTCTYLYARFGQYVCTKYEKLISTEDESDLSYICDAFDEDDAYVIGEL
jgi:hypothetical protein